MEARRYSSGAADWLLRLTHSLPPLLAPYRHVHALRSGGKRRACLPRRHSLRVNGPGACLLYNHINQPDTGKGLQSNAPQPASAVVSRHFRVASQRNSRCTGVTMVYGWRTDGVRLVMIRCCTSATVPLLSRSGARARNSSCGLDRARLHLYGGFTSGGNAGGIRGLEIVRDNRPHDLYPPRHENDRRTCNHRRSTRPAQGGSAPAPAAGGARTL